MFVKGKLEARLQLAFWKGGVTDWQTGWPRTFDMACDLQILPELHFAAGDDNGQLSDGEWPTALRSACAQRRQALLFGYEELCSGEIFSATQLIDRRGVAIANYRCAHPSSQRHGVGRWLTVAPIGSQRLALLLGDDLWAPEVWRAYALGGATAIVWSGRNYADSEWVLRTRAVENGIAVVGMGGAHAFGFAADGSALPIVDREHAIQLELPSSMPSGPPLRRQPILYRRLVSDGSESTR